MKRYWWLGLFALAGCADATAPEDPCVTQTVVAQATDGSAPATAEIEWCVTYWRMP